MIRRNGSARRRAATTVESAIVYPLTFLFLLGLLVGGMGVFRYQQVASLAREGARWASVRGGQYGKDTGQQAATAQDVHTNVVLANAVSLDPAALQTAVTWNPDNWPSHATSDNGNAVTHTVTVTVTYQWIPEAYLGGITLSSTSVMPISY